MAKKYADMTPEQKERNREASKRWRARNPERVKEISRNSHRRKWAQLSPEERREMRMRGLSKYPPEQRKEKRRQWYARAGRRHRGLPAPTRPPPERCECCGGVQEGKSLALDHDHSTGKFRGWLCARCNKGLGVFGDTVDGLARAIEYLLRSHG